MPYKYTFALRIPFHLFHCWCHTSTNPSPSLLIIIMSQHLAWSSLNDTIHITSSCDLWFIDLDLTCSSPLLRSVSTKSCSSLLATRFIASKPLTYSSHLQLVHQAKPHLDLLHLVTRLHVMSHMQWAPSSHVWAMQHIQAIFTSMA
jgi:hypothetical protein